MADTRETSSGDHSSCANSEATLGVEELKAQLAAERELTGKLIDALQHIKRMKPTQIVEGIVHGPQLLLDNCQREARRTLALVPADRRK